jgi:hypothetical protein
MAYDATKPANNSALVSSEVRANFVAFEGAIGNPDSATLTIKKADHAALSTFADAPTYKPGAASTFAAQISGLLTGSVDSVQHANGTTVETDLSSFSLGANTLSANTKILRVTFWGTFAANANTKTIRFKFGASSFQIYSSTTNGGSWKAVCEVQRTGAATQKVTGWVMNSTGGGVTGASGTAAETLSGAVTVKSTGQSGTASSDILQENFFAEVVG